MNSANLHNQSHFNGNTMSSSSSRNRAKPSKAQFINKQNLNSSSNGLKNGHQNYSKQQPYSNGHSDQYLSAKSFQRQIRDQFKFMLSK